MLEGELDAHLDYDRHQKSISTNIRNGYTKKKLKTTLGDTEINVPKDRETCFNPMVVKNKKKRKYYRKYRKHYNFPLCKTDE
ncbi:transposase [Polaribacter sp. 11A2H]|uniref:transposase n=1 Tax=Polaribacter sp. 11A2H TaxID=2687290 RepID=UPI00293BB418|nr:transposase [Polaribacter sp. 11A2H]